MMQTSKSNEDPGGSPCRYHEDQSHRPIVPITNSKREVVQLTPRITFPFSDETAILLRNLMHGKGLIVGTNGKTRMVAQSGGIVRYPAGSPDAGTVTHAFPITFTSEALADVVESRLREVAQEFVNLVPDSEFLGFVENHSKTILEMETSKSRMELERERAEWAKRIQEKKQCQRHIVTGNEDVIDTVGDQSSVELSNETPSRNDQHGESDGDTIGAETTRA